MRLSKILKDQKQEQVSRFNFQEINQSSNTQEGETKDPESSSENKTDPLEELEETIRRQLLEAERRAQEIEREAYQKGYEQGQKDGFDFGAKKVRIIQEQLEQLAEQMASLPNRVLNDYRRWLLQTALTLAKRIVRCELSVNETLLESLVEEILQDVDRSHQWTLVLHPKDKALLEKHGILSRWIREEPPEIRPLRIETDEAVGRGGCRLIGDLQEVDATLETRFQELEKRLWAMDDHESPSEPV